LQFAITGFLYCRVVVAHDMVILMKRTLAVALATFGLIALPSFAAKGRSSASRTHNSRSRTFASKKSLKPGSADGKYVGGKGSSHKGGHYTNASTGNRERNRKAGVPK